MKQYMDNLPLRVEQEFRPQPTNEMARATVLELNV